MVEPLAWGCRVTASQLSSDRRDTRASLIPICPSSLGFLKPLPEYSVYPFSFGLWRQLGWGVAGAFIMSTFASCSAASQLRNAERRQLKQKLPKRVLDRPPFDRKGVENKEGKKRTR
jgi:hypothetical protein